MPAGKKNAMQKFTFALLATNVIEEKTGESKTRAITVKKQSFP